MIGKNKHLCILGRQPKIALAELEALFGSENTAFLPPNLAIVTTKKIDVTRLGGTIKAGKILENSPLDFLKTFDKGKLTLGVSDFRRHATPHTATAEALKLKTALRKLGYSIRTVPNTSPILSSATSHHNKLGVSRGKIELAFFEGGVASLASQNITAYASRDQSRPARDARVGMLPPKLAQILINLCGPLPPESTILDPFCGTGVILQEALLLGFKAYGTDLEPRMIDYSRKNLDWLSQHIGRGQRDISSQYVVSPHTPLQGCIGEALKKSDSPSEENPTKHSAISSELDEKKTFLHTRANGHCEKYPSGFPAFELSAGDATNFTWKQPVNAVASETYLGQPFSAPPSEVKLREVELNCRSIIKRFLKNLAPQIAPNAPVVIAIPAWRRPNDLFYRLKILDELEPLGYNLQRFKNLDQSDLLYYRENQVVARELLVLRRK